MTVHNSNIQNLPIIDLSDLHSPCHAARERLSRQIFKACSETGFFYIKNHGVPQDLINATHTAAQQFFSLPEDQKMKYYLGNSNSFHGYSPLYGEKSSNPDLEETSSTNPPGALSEAFDVGYELATDHQKHSGDVLPPDTFGLLGENQWPSEEVLPGFSATYRHYLAEVLELARGLMKAFALALGQREDFFDASMVFPGVTSRMLHYPPQPVPGEEIPGLAAHTDYECFTILSQDSVPALQVRTHSGEWMVVPPIPGTFIVNISDSLAFWTNNTFKSTVHRVANLTGQERYSIPFFVGVDYNTTIEVMENQISADRPPPGKPFKAGDYVRDKLSRAYIGYGGEPAGEE